MNSEIVGVTTDVPWGFRFIHAAGLDNPELPRHPAQLYEAVCYLISFFILSTCIGVRMLRNGWGLYSELFNPDF